MSRDTFGLNAELRAYLGRVGYREAEILHRLRAETAKMPMAMMQIAPEQGALLALLVQFTQARRCLEIGVFTGYSALAVALALPETGRITACDVNEEWTELAQRYWKEAGVAHKIDLHLRPALETLASLIAQGQAESFDFAFIDADKPNYSAYYKETLKLIRPGGLLCIDNVLWNGRVVDPADREESTEAIRSLNRLIADDERVEHVLLPVGDGITLVRKR